MSKAFSLLVIASLMPAPVAAQITFDNSAPPAQGQAAPKPGEKLICEKEETVGSRLGAKKVCLTKSQWDEQKREHRETLEKFQQQNTSVGTPSG